MSVPISQMWTVATYVLKQRAAGRRRFPLVLMLEPLFRCNLACAGCGKIQYPVHILKRQLSPDECFKAVEECGAPMVSIPGGEPLLHPQVAEIVQGLVQRKKYIYLCTNALLLKQKIDLFQPSKYLTFSVHLDGQKQHHDLSVCREGAYDLAVEGIREALKHGFRVTTNTTLFIGADPSSVRAFFDEMMDLGVEGMTISPGYGYETAPDRERFLGKTATRRLFRAVLGNRKRRWRFNQSPLFLEFLMDLRNYACTPWGMPSYSLFGWQKPCYLLQDGYVDTFAELMEQTEWHKYGAESGNPKCANCMVHSGYEASAVNDTFGSIRGLWQTVKASAFSGGYKNRVIIETLAGTDSDLARPVVLETEPPARETAHRGDVMITLKNGERLEGYVFDRKADGASLDRRLVRLFPKEGNKKIAISFSDIARLEFTGRDTAAGRRFEVWLKSHRERSARGERNISLRAC